MCPRSAAFPCENNIQNLAVGEHLTNIQAIWLPRLVRVLKTSIASFSLSVNCHSALSVKLRLNLVLVSSGVKEYVGSGGMKAILAAILDGHGGQQKRQQISRILSPFMVAGNASSRCKQQRWGFLWDIQLAIYRYEHKLSDSLLFHYSTIAPLKFSRVFHLIFRLMSKKQSSSWCFHPTSFGKLSASCNRL